MVLEEADVYLFIGIYYAELLVVGKNLYFSLYTASRFLIMI